LQPRVIAGPIRAGRLADELGEAGAERSERGAADLKADLGDGEVASPQQGHRALDAPGHQVAVRRLAVGGAEAPREVAGGHAGRAGQRRNVERARVLAVHLISRTTQPHQVIAIHGPTLAPILTRSVVVPPYDERATT